MTMLRTHKGRANAFWLTILLFVLSGSPADAQDERQQKVWEQQQRAECRLAHQVLTHGQPADKRSWALGVIGTCPSSGREAIAAELDRLRGTETRTDELEALVMATGDFADRRIVEKALEVASDPAAGTVARVQAIRMLSYQVTPATFLPYEAYVRPTGPIKAIIAIPHTEGFIAGDDPVTESDVRRIMDVLTSVAEEPSTPELVRIAAELVAGQAEVALL